MLKISWFHIKAIFIAWHDYSGIITGTLATFDLFVLSLALLISGTQARCALKF